MKIDLHTHSTASDGTLSPSELLTLAGSCGVRVLALTDHDTLAGVPAALEAAEREGIVLVPGLEISTLWNGRSIHVVGLGVHHEDPEINAKLSGTGEKRLNRGRAIAEKLAEFGFAGAYEGAMRFAAHPETLSRAHFARWMTMMGHVKSTQQAFDQYLGDDKPAYIAAPWPSVADAVRMIGEAGGIAVLAHPGRYKLKEGFTLRDLVSEFTAAGGRAIEVCSGSQSAESEPEVADLAREFSLYASLGSDFHNLKGTRPRPGDLRKLPEDIPPVWEHIPGFAMPE